MVTEVAPPRAAAKWVGSPVPRREDLRLVQGQGRFVDDMRLPNLAYAVFVRSPYAHARIRRVEAGPALRLPGVIAVLTGADLARRMRPFPNLLPPPYSEMRDYGIAVEKARYAGEPVAVIIAEDKYVAYDALELVEVEYEPLPPVASAARGLEPDAPLVHENLPSNLVWHRRFTYGDVDAAFREARVVVRETLQFHRFTSAPLEPNAVLVHHDPLTGVFTVWSNNQRPGFNAHFIAHALGLAESNFRFITADIGGGFGIKNDSYPYIAVLCACAQEVGRPVKWVETRREHLQASAHGNEVTYEAEMAFGPGGEVLGYRARAVHDEGAYMRREPIGAINFIRHATSVYRFRNLEMEVLAVVTNKCPVGPNRSYGKMQQCYLIERLMERGARALGLDPAEVRKVNLVRPDEMPYETPTGALLDGGDYPRALELALARVDYEGLRREQAEARRQGRLLGVGIAIGMDAAPVNFSINRLINPEAQASGDSEGAWVRVDEEGSVLAAVGTAPQGHGHETVVAQIVADELGLHPDAVQVVSGFDSWVNPYTAHSGTYASRFASTGAPAVQGAARKVREKLIKIAAHLLGEDPAELYPAEGHVVSGRTGRRVSLREVAKVAWRDVVRLPEGEEPGLFAAYFYRVPFGLPKDEQRGNFSLTYSYSAAAVVVEVDPETGRVTLRRAVIVEDCGRKLNPLIVEGQIHGQLGHQLGAALFERLFYDENGQLLTATFKDYLVPTAADLVSFEVETLETPSLSNPLGARGMGEGGGAPLIACVNAVEDALSPLGIRLTGSHVDPDQVRRLIRAAGARPG